MFAHKMTISRVSIFNLVCLGVIFFYFIIFPKTHTVVLTPEGFSPKDITVTAGTVVEFVTSTNEPFWPASNIHPYHTLSPDFDPKRPLQPDETWSFTFDALGRYGYHDHIKANFTGSVTVVDNHFFRWSGATAASVKSEEACLRVPLEQKTPCWEGLLEHTLKESGLQAAFDLFIKLYETEPDIAKGCHGWGHILGKGAYDLYVSDKNFAVPDEASYCGYGFFHGFLAAMLEYSGDPKEVLEFCERLKNNPSKKDTQEPYRNCFHGIGHGATDNAVEMPANQGDIDAVLRYGKSFCVSLVKDSFYLEECIDGVYNELTQTLANGLYGFKLEMLEGDAFFLCRGLVNPFLRSCYFESIGIIRFFYDDNFLDVADRLLKDIDDPATLEKLFVRLAADRMEHDIINTNYEKNVADCRALPGNLYEICLNGIALGFFAHGEPGKEIIKFRDFCTHDYLNAREKEYCESYAEYAESS